MCREVRACRLIRLGDGRFYSIGHPRREARHGKLRKELAAAREGARLTQRERAAKLKRPPSYIGKIENGERKIEVFEFVDGCEAVGVKPGAMLKRVKD